MLLALELVGGNLWGDIGSANWPHFAESLIQGFVDPRIGLGGVIAGFNMVVSGLGNLLSQEQWERDPLGNLLKSAADIATGIAIILGSVALLATAIAVILTAIAIAIVIFSFGAGAGAALALAPVIEFCGSVAATVGPWAIEASEIALALQALVLIKNLVATACADSATEMQRSAERVDEDAKAAAGMALAVGLAKVMGHGGEEPVPPGGETPPPPPDMAPPPVEPPAVVPVEPPTAPAPPV